MNVRTDAGLYPLALVTAAALLLPLAGCGGPGPGYTGGGLPPGPLDIGGVVLREAAPALALRLPPVEGAQVTLVREDDNEQDHAARQTVGHAVTGPGGYFAFGKPPTGEYTVVVVPPRGSGLQNEQESFEHEGGTRTYLRIVLRNEDNQQ